MERKGRQKPDPLKIERVGHPENLNQFLGIAVLESYHPSEFARQRENTRRGVPPSMTLSALSRDTYSLRAAGSSFLFLLKRAFALSCILTKAR